jgi:hypothetical protein
MKEEVILRILAKGIPKFGVTVAKIWRKEVIWTYL